MRAEQCVWKTRSFSLRSVMPRIFDNIDLHLRPELVKALEVSHRADFCVGYFNLRGWQSVGERIAKWKGGITHCRSERF